MLKNKKFLTTSFLIFLITFLFLSPKTANAGALDSVSDTLSTSRLSFFGQIGTGSTATELTINVGSSGPSTDTANLFPGDTVLLGNDDTASEYTVDDIVSSSQFTTTSGVDSADNDTNDVIVASRSATHTISLAANSVISNGSFEVLIKSTSNSDKSKDGLPDQDGFDFGDDSVDPSVVCEKSSGSGTYSFSAGTAKYYGETGCTANGGYHCFECTYTGDSAADDVVSITIGATQPLINPSPDGVGSPGDADDYIIKVRHKNNGGVTIDDKDASVAVVESVRVSATVDPTITFEINGISADSGSYCGVSRDSGSIDTTAYSVPFGSLVLGAFNDAVQELTCITNADSGYSVTVIEDDQMSIDGENSVELDDTDCDADTCSYSSNGAWESENDESGFGYSIENVDAANVTFAYGDCGTSFCARAFPSTADGHDPVQVMYNTSTPSGNENAYVCYRLAIGTTQEPGDYENAITYVATATF